MAAGQLPLVLVDFNGTTHCEFLSSCPLNHPPPPLSPSSTKLTAQLEKISFLTAVSKWHMQTAALSAHQAALSKIGFGLQCRF